MTKGPEMASRLNLARPERDRSPCIWMQGGVVRRKFCDRDYECASCRFDKALEKAARENREGIRGNRTVEGKAGRIVSWKDRLRDRPASKRPCIHHMKGRIEFRACHHDYRCGNCDFDQFFLDQFSVHAVVRPVRPMEVKGFKVPQGYYFHRGHTWVKVEEGSTVRVGMDDFVLRLLGPLDRIEAPLMGREIRQGRPDTTAFRGGERAGVLSPVTGVVTTINPALREDARRAGDAPYSEGWVMNVHAPHLRDDLRDLMIHTETQAFMEGEVHSLFRLVEAVGGPLSTDGGDLGWDIYGNMPQLRWERLIRTFLRNG
jgi:glycine cleavage system H lipoate-binding protein